MTSCRVPGSPPTPLLSARKLRKYHSSNSLIFIPDSALWQLTLSWHLTRDSSRARSKPSRLTFQVSKLAGAVSHCHPGECVCVGGRCQYCRIPPLPDTCKLILWTSLLLFISPNNDSLFSSTENHIIFLFSALLKKIGSFGPWFSNKLPPPPPPHSHPSPGHLVSYSKLPWRDDLGLTLWKTRVLCINILLGNPLGRTPPKSIELMSQGKWDGNGHRKQDHVWGVPFSLVSYCGGNPSDNTIASCRTGDLCLRARDLGRTRACIAMCFLSGTLALVSSVFEAFCYCFCLFRVFCFVCFCYNYLDRYLTTNACCVFCIESYAMKWRSIVSIRVIVENGPGPVSSSSCPC